MPKETDGSFRTAIQRHDYCVKIGEANGREKNPISCFSAIKNAFFGEGKSNLPSNRSFPINK